MQKKLLLSLMLSVPAAQVAMANITLDSLKDPSKWNASGITGADFQVNQADNSVQCGIGSGVVSQTVTGLPAGSYTLSFANSDNITVAINGVTVELTDGVYPFTLKADGNVEIAISAENVSLPFSFEKALIAFAQDFAAQAEEFNTELAKAAFVEIGENVPEATKKALEEEKATILKDKTPIDEILTAMAGEDKNTYEDAIEVKDFIKIYQKYDLANGFKTIDDQIDAYAAKVAAWNKKATNANTQANLLDEVTDLTASIDALIKRINNASDPTTPEADKTPDYAKNLDLPKAEALKAEITAYGETIKNTTDFEKFESQAEVLAGKITSLEKQLDSDIADYNAWVSLTTAFDTFDKAYVANQNTVNAYAGVGETYKTVYSDLIPGWQKELTDAYNTAKEVYDQYVNPTTPTVGLATAVVKDKDGKDTTVLVSTAVTDAFATATTSFNKTLADSKALVDGQNTAYNDATEVVAGYQAKYESLATSAVPDTKKQEYLSQLAEIKALIDNLKTYIDTEYRAHTLDLTKVGYTDQTTAIDNAVTVAENLEQAFLPLTNLQKQFDDAKAQIAEDYEGSKIPEDIFNLPAVLQTTYNDIQAAINNVSVGSDGSLNDTEITEISNAIKNLLDTANKLLGVFGPTYTQLNAFQTALGEYKTFIDNKLVVLDCLTAAKKLAESSYTEWSEDITDYIADLKKAGQASGQEIYTQAVAVGTAFTAQFGEGDGWKTKLAADKLTFSKAVTDTNKAAVDKYLADVKKVATTVDFTTVDANLAAIATEIAAATTPEAYGKCDVKLQDFAKSLQVFESMATTFNNLQEEIDALTENNNTNSTGAGKTYFEGVIADLQTEYDTLVGKIVTALNEGKIEDGKAAFEKSLSELGTKISNTNTDIDNNNLYHTSQLGKSTEVGLAIQDIINTIQGENKQHDATIIAGWIEALQSLQQNDLIANDLVVSKAYGIGESMAQNTAIMDEYDRILEEANKVLGEYNGEFGQAVIDANNKFLQDISWDNLLDKLYREYLDAIGEYNAYIYGLTNPGYKAAILAAIGTHQSLYDYAAKITALRAAAAQCVADANKDGVVLTDKTFMPAAEEGTSADLFVDTANGYIAAMQAQVAQMNADARQVAIQYYNDQLNIAVNAINDAETTMETQGIMDGTSTDPDVTLPDFITPTLKEARTFLGEAASLYMSILDDHDKAAADKDYKPNYGPLALEMDEVANILDKVVPSINLQKAAEQQWAYSYGEATDRIAEIKADLDKYASAEGANETAYEELLEQFNEIVNGNEEKNIPGVKGLNEQANENTENLITDFKADQLDPLANYMAQLEQLADKSETQQEMEAAILDFNNDLDALKAYINGFTSAFGVSTTDIESMIENFKSLVQAPAALANQANLEAQKAAIDAAIVAKYAEAAKAELTALEGWMPKLQIAFNDASKNNKNNFTDAELQAMNEEIDSYVGELVLLSTPASTTNKDGKGFTFETRDQFQKDAEALMAKMTQMYTKLQSSWTDNPVTLAVDALTELYNTISGVITTGEGELAGYEPGVQEKYEGQYEALQAELDAIKKAWEADIDNTLIVSSQDKYEEQLNAVQDAVDTLKANIEADQKIQLESNTRYTELKAEWDELNASYENLKAEVESYGLIPEGAGANSNDYFSFYLRQIQELLAESEEALNEGHENYTLTSKSELENALAISETIAGVDYQANYRYANIVTKNAASEALAKVQDALLGNVVNPEALTEQLNALYTRFDENNKLNPGNMFRNEENLAILKQMIEEYKAISTDAAALLESVEANTYVKGDVNLNPDGEVNAVDVQMLVSWVGEGMTYDELLKENPRQAYAADITGDKKLNIADVTATIKLAMGMNASEVTAAQYSQNGVQGGDHYSIAYMGEVDGADRYAIVLNNTNDLVAGQFDIKLGAGMNLVRVVNAERSEGHNVAVYDHSMSEARVVLFSLENAPIAGNAGAVVFVDVQGTGNIAVEQMIFADDNAKAYIVDDIHTSGIIDSIIDGVKEGKEAIYDAAGRVYDRIHRGLNIIRKSDGSVSKEIHK